MSAAPQQATVGGPTPLTASVRRKWTAITIGTAMTAAVPVCFRFAEGFPTVIPTDIAGTPDESAAWWLGGGLALTILIPFALAYVSGHERWGVAGLIALGAAVATAVFASALSEELSGASGMWILVVAAAGGIALRHEDRSELTARLTAAALLFGFSWALPSVGLPALLPLITLASLGVADAVVARFT